MTKKNLIILLLIPFLIALLGVVTINTTFHFIDNDIIAIQWDYDDTEAFQLQDNLYLLEAVGVNQKNYPAGAGNTLVWSIRNRNIEDDNVYGEIVKQDQHYYLKTLVQMKRVQFLNPCMRLFMKMEPFLFKRKLEVLKTILIKQFTMVNMI